MSDRLDSLAQGENFVFKKPARIEPALLQKEKKSSHSINNESLHATTHHLYFPGREKKREMQLLLTKMSYFSHLSVFFCLCLPSFPSPKKIDEENEANLLAVLTETLDSIPVDEDGLPSFEALADGDVTNASDRSCPSSPDGSPRTPEPEESLVRPTARPFARFSHHHHHSRVKTYVISET